MIKQSTDEKAEAEIVIQIGLDVLHILAERFRQEMGKQFDRIWEDSLSELQGFAQVLFEDIHANRENQEINVTIMKSRYQGMPGEKDCDMVAEAFLAVISGVAGSIKRYLGGGVGKDAMKGVVKVLTVVEKYHRDRAVTEIFLRRIREIL